MGALYSPVSVLLTIIRIEYMYTLYVSLLQHRVPWQWLVIVILKQEIHHRQPQNTVCSAQHPARPPKSGYHKTLSVRPSTQPVLPRVATTKHCLFIPAHSLSSQEWLPQNTVCSAQHPARPPKSGYHKTLSVHPSTQPVLTRVATTKHCLFGPAPSPSSQEWLPQNTVCSAQHPARPPKSGYHKTLSVRPSTQPVLPRVATTKHCLFGPAPNLSSQEWLPQNTVRSAQHPARPPNGGRPDPRPFSTAVGNHDKGLLLIQHSKQLLEHWSCDWWVMQYWSCDWWVMEHWSCD